MARVESRLSIANSPGLMKEFRRGKGIKSKSIRLEGAVATAKGYDKADFEEDFAAYLGTQTSSEEAKPPFRSDPPTQSKDPNELVETYSDTENAPVSDENTASPLKTNDCDGVSDKNDASSLKTNDCDGVSDEAPDLE